MKKNLAKKITLSILAGAMLMSSSVGWAAKAVVQEGTEDSTKWTAIVVNGRLDPAKNESAQVGSDGYGSIAIGNGAKANVGTDLGADNAIAIGASSNAAGQYGIAVGLKADATAYSTTAIGTQAGATSKGASALGGSATASGEGATAIGSGTIASGEYSLAEGYGAKASGDYSNAVGSGATASESNSHAFGTNAEASGVQSIAIGPYAEASGFNSIAIGLDTSAIADGAIALGYGSVASVEDAVSVGNGGAVGSSGPTTRSIINVKDVRVKDLGNDNYGSYAVNVNTLNAALDNVYTKTEADAKFATQQSLTDGLASKADKATTLAGYGITDAYTKTEADELLGKKANAANVYTKTEIDSELGKKADQSALDAEKTAREQADQDLQSQIDNIGGGAIAGINQRLDKTNTKINRVGAGAAALAALHPLEYDPDDKLTFSAGMGNYAGENAAALGAFYRPNEKFMLSLGGTMGNGENMVNLGLSIGLDKPNGFAKLSKRELIQKVNVMEAKYEQVEAENEAMKDQLANADERIAKLEALVAQLVKK